MAQPRQQSTPEDVEEAEIIARCRQGEAGAFRLLYDRHFRGVHRLARRLGTPSAELDDVTQQVFTNAFRKLDTFGGGTFAHWLHRICANVATDHHRKRSVRDGFRRLLGLDPDREVSQSPSPEGQLVRSEAELQVGQILARMRPKHREVFVLFELEKLSGEEIAAQVGCPINTVWTRIHHARAAFVRIGQKRGWIAQESDA